MGLGNASGWLDLDERSGKICAGRGAEGFETQRKGTLLQGTSQPWQHVHGCVHRA